MSGPFGAVKEQSSGLYAQTMAERGYLTIAFDPSYTGESGGFPRGFHARSGNSTDGWNMTSNISWLNTNLLQFAHEIESAVMVLHGERAHSLYMGEMIYKKLIGDNKEYVIVPGATHCDLYDGGATDAIPWDKIEAFFGKNL